MWNELTFLWNELAILWNDLTMERNDRLPSCTWQTTDKQIKIFVTENTESDTLYGRLFGRIHHCRLKFIVTLKIERFILKQAQK